MTEIFNIYQDSLHNRLDEILDNAGNKFSTTILVSQKFVACVLNMNADKVSSTIENFDSWEEMAVALAKYTDTKINLTEGDLDIDFANDGTDIQGFYENGAWAIKPNKKERFSPYIANRDGQEIIHTFMQ